MFKTLKKRIKNEKGLSLVELLAVIVIMAIIAAIAIPAIGNIINTSRDKSQVSDALSIIAGAKLAHIENGCGDTGCAEGNEKGNLEEFVDGKDVSTVTVTLDGSEWKISNYTFNFKSKDFKDQTPTTEADLKALID
ncbi:Tfp pilus assembly protein, major pilin PilA [Solibacillus silvestris StLB046]|uniref:Tfp pilus assembly protein, major pilin PilA n=1 Tax=Solibacillus silvestris (strain StLB046) TaxID=1002809 RepID=F2F446_SOLSS|nr:prepilin-type N-terminal cleavage/methylation domain-containing protein [Solibacillus silvestris]BAK18076.1 Tfp pilus assembly protein, major pilin PilA [Solibacillus silvestris StLB046]